MSGARLRFALIALAMAPVLTGCVVFKGTPRGKQIDENKVRVTFTICASGGPSSSCPDLGNEGDDADDGDHVVLLGLRVPDGSRVPDELRPVRSDVPGVLRRARQYGSVLNDEAPTPVGFKWIGYRSAPKLAEDGDAASSEGGRVGKE